MSRAHRLGPSTSPGVPGILGLLALLVPTGACAPTDDGAIPTDAPNVLFVVWDTTRADHLSLYGHERPTTPFLERWAADALVFEDCLSPGSSTVPAHGALFTGLLPTEHGANNRYLHLAEEHRTLAELFGDAGYGTFAFSANPHISAEENFTQGFQRVEHPWDPKHRQEALAIVRAKVPLEDESSELPGLIRGEDYRTWDLKASGELAGRALLDWLDECPPDRPWFAFLNYMEAHRPFVTPRRFRRLFMDAEQVERSYTVDRSWSTLWRFTFGLHEYTPEELETMALTYDACIRELDHLFEELIGELARDGRLANTIVVLVGDHGEHLGEHHMLDHQYSLYQGLIHVPLLLSWPGHVSPGRSAAPVSSMDLFPTLLELAGLEAPAGQGRDARSLLAPAAERARLSEFPADFEAPLRTVQALHPEWDPGPWRRRLTALVEGERKLLWASDGRHELYDLAADPRERDDLAARRPEELAGALARLRERLEALVPFRYEAAGLPQLSEHHRRRLEALGYFDGGGD